MKQTLILLASVGLFAVQAFGADVRLAAPNKKSPLPNFSVSYVQSDLDKDGLKDVAVLVKSESKDGMLDLKVKVSSTGAVYTIKDVADRTSSDLYGVGVKLKLNKAGSFLVESFNDAIGRNRWSRTLTFAYRNQELVLAGYTYKSRDTLSLENMKCDINLLTQMGIIEGKVNLNSEEESPKLEAYTGAFEVLEEDIFSVEELSYEKADEAYLSRYCHAVVGEVVADLVHYRN